jgi:anaerobic selenocysteine-containing dehydrogenase
VLPCLGRTERDAQHDGLQFVSVEDSMSAVHRSEGRLEPASGDLRSEVAIVADLAQAVLGAKSAVPWSLFASNYDRIRDAIERVVPGFSDYNRRVREPGGFVLPSGARTRRFDTPDGRAHFTVHALPDDAVARAGSGSPRCAATTSSTPRSTARRPLSRDPRRSPRGAGAPRGPRRGGARGGERVDLTSHFRGETRCVRGFRTVAYDVPRGCAAAYFPEANPLVALDSVAHGSHTPTYKSIEVSITPSAES